MLFDYANVFDRVQYEKLYFENVNIDGEDLRFIRNRPVLGQDCKNPHSEQYT